MNVTIRERFLMIVIARRRVFNVDYSQDDDDGDDDGDIFAGDVGERGGSTMLRNRW